MYLSDTEYQDLMERIDRLESCLPVACELDALLHDRVLGCITGEERAVTVGECDDGDGFLDPELFIDIVSHNSEDEIWLPDAHERLTLDEYTNFLRTWIKISNDEGQLESLLTLGAILMRKERKIFVGELKQVRDVRAKLFKRAEQLKEYVWSE